MDTKRLIRILTKKLEPHFGMTTCALQQKVSSAVQEAMEETSELEDLLEQLHTRIVRFSYRKTDGSFREAIGTLKPSVLDKLSAGMKPRRHTSWRSDCIVYYDLDREDWRCFCPENFVTMN
ncbi:SH3 beta-barrel fold-containing protein [Alistipes dispar]|uniref:SH3 beta-barrel fold-containing protein n=1 Tax=Alistipes dispar TaxID=2585119 RepID=UPI003A8C51C3